MKKYFNRNHFWADLFVNQLMVWGIKHVCISPGSRNTPLTMAFATNKKFKKIILADERSSGFFALGISKDSLKPVVVVTTSGTAVAELYPAIIEAYYERIPMIICTADRPKFLRNTGANQTINQDNIFSNHIRYFKDLELPSLNKAKLKSYIHGISESVKTAVLTDPGPVHLNFPFKKPLEPNSFSDNINLKLSEFLTPALPKEMSKPKIDLRNVFNKLENSSRPLIHFGWDNYDKELYKILSKISVKHKIPVLVDGATDLRFTNFGNSSFFTNHSSFISHIRKSPDIIIQFGNAPTSKQMLEFLSNTKALRLLVNNFGDVKDPSPNKGLLIIEDPVKLLNGLSEYTINRKWTEWFRYLSKLETISENNKSIIKKGKFVSEPGTINLILKSIPNNSNILVSNSLPIRDFDYFASKRKKNFKIYTNRGASGIDGIISTASGVAWNSKKPSFLIIGDLAFYHNLSALSTLDQLKIPLKIILFNNGGGSIFRMLPISEDNEFFNEYFLTPQELNYGNITKAFNGKYFKPRSLKSFEENLKKISNLNRFSVTELKTNSEESVELRKKYWKIVKEAIYNNEN